MKMYQCTFFTSLPEIIFHLDVVASGQNKDLRGTIAQIPTPFLLGICKMKVHGTARKLSTWSELYGHKQHCPTCPSCHSLFLGLRDCFKRQIYNFRAPSFDFCFQNIIHTFLLKGILILLILWKESQLILY